MKMAKLQMYRPQFDTLKMNEDEDIAILFLRVDEVSNIMLGLGETINKSVIVQKFLRSLPSKFNPKVSAIEETTNFETLNRDQLCGSLIVYGMRIPTWKETNREAAFKAYNPIEEKECSC